MVSNQEEPGVVDGELLSRAWFKLVKIERVETSADYWSLRREIADSQLLIIATNENGRVVIDGHTVPTRAGLVLACRPGQWVEAGALSGAGSTLYLLYYKMGIPAGEEEQETENSRICLLEGEYQLPDAAAVCGMIHQSWHRADIAGQLHAQAGFHELLALLVNEKGQETMHAIESVRKEIDHCYDEEISIERLAALSGISRYHLMRIFKERYGKSIVEYITEVRLHYAKKLMLAEDRSINEIAEKVGFQSAPYFRTVFKKQVGISPAVYLRNRQRKVAAYSWPVLGQLLPLQTVPYAAPLDHYWTNEFRAKFSSDIVVPLGHHYEFNRKALRLAKPDCIIGLDSTISPDEEQRLLEIAPLLLLRWMEDDWRTHLQRVAAFLDRTMEGGHWLEQYEEKANSMRKHVRSMTGLGKLLVIKISGDGLFVWGRRTMTVLYDDLQFEPASLADGVEWYKPITPEELWLCNPDRMIVVADCDARSQAYRHSLLSSERWKSLKAVRSRTVYLMSGYSSWVYPWVENTALHHERFLEGVPNLLLCSHP